MRLSKKKKISKNTIKRNKLGSTKRNKLGSTKKNKLGSTKKNKLRSTKKIRKKVKNKINNQKGSGVIVIEDKDIEGYINTVNSIYLDTCILQYLINNNKLEINNGYIKINDFSQYIIKRERDNKINGGGYSNTNKSINNNNFNSNEKLLIVISKNFEQNLIDNKNNFDNGLYIEPIIIKENNKDNNIKNDISYVKKLCEELGNNQENCNLKYKDYVFKEEILEKDILIIGYPNPKFMFPILSEKDFWDEYNNIANEQKHNYPKYLTELFNTLNDKQINDTEEYSDFYKFVGDNFDSYKKNINAINEELDTKLQNNYDEILKVKNDEILKNFQRPNIKIHYVFFILKKIISEDSDNFSYEPLIYNIRELNENHKDYLIMIQDIIKKKIPKKFNLLLDGEQEYDNFHSYYEYGDIFHIETEYLHPISQLPKFSHKYQKQINLEELIYSCDIKDDIKSEPFWKNVEYEFPISKYLLQNNNQFKSREYKKNLNLPIIRETKLRYEAEYEDKSKIIMVNTNSIYEINIIYRNKEEGKSKYYFSKWKINIWYAKNIMENDNIEKEEIYDCEKKILTGKIKSEIKNYSFILLEEREITKNNNIFKQGWSFPTIKHNQINRKYNNYEYLPLLVYNIYNNSKKQTDNVITFDGNCKYKKCEDIEYTEILYYPELDSKYKVVINKLENKIMLWVFLINNDDINKLKGKIIKDTNRIKNIYDFNDPDFGTYLINKLKEKNYLINDKMIICNKYSAETHNSFHLQIVDKNYYQSPLYKTNITQNTETRMINFINAINFMKINRNYYTNISNCINNGRYSAFFFI